MEVGLSEGVEGGNILCKGPEAELSVCSRRSKRPETLMLGKIKEEKWATENEMVQELNLGLSHCRQILYHLSHQGST